MAKAFRDHKLNALLILFMIFIGSIGTINAQCPTVVTPIQSFCDLESPTIADLTAIDNGNGIQWFDTAVSITPLNNSAALIAGEDYYADDNSGSCGPRERVDVIIYGPPTGFSFQGVCVDDPNDATISDLDATGNNVLWYNAISGGTPLAGSTVLIDNTIYYAEQENPDTGCKTSRLSVFVNVGIVPIPIGDAIQTFCSTSAPTVGDLVAIGADNWYSSISSVIPINLSEPLVNGEDYFATSADPPCESSDRLEVTVIIDVPANSGINGSIDICEIDIPAILTLDLLNELTGTPDPGGSWTGPLPTLNGDLGTVDITPMNVGGSPYIFTYSVDSGNSCPPSSSTVTIAIVPEPIAGSDGSIDICGDDSTQDLFNALGGSPDSGGTWSPALNSGSGIFDPSVDPPGTYTYTVGPDICGLSASATLIVTIETILDATGLEISTSDICPGESNTVNLTGANLLPDGDYTINYELSVPNFSENSIEVTFAAGNASFTIPSSLVLNPGETTLTITGIIPMMASCSADISLVLSTNFIIYEDETPEIVENGNVFCEDINPVIDDLTANIIGIHDLTWYDAPTGGTAYLNSTLLINGETYYASILTSEGCESLVRLETTIVLENCPVDIIIPDGFSPNNDSINDDFDIVDIRELYPNFSIEIYNRYGKVLYKGDKNTPNWNGYSSEGSFSDSKVPVGVYFYILKFNDGIRDPIQGRVYLNR